MLGLMTDVFSQAVAVLVLGHSKPSRFKLSRKSLNVQLREVMMRLLINYKSKIFKLSSAPTKISGVAQGCHLGNQVELVLGSHII